MSATESTLRGGWQVAHDVAPLYWRNSCRPEQGVHLWLPLDGLAVPTKHAWHPAPPWGLSSYPALQTASGSTYAAAKSQ